LVKSAKSAEKRFIEDQHVLSEVFMRFQGYKLVTPPRAEDQLTTDQRVMFEKQEMPLSVLFKLQVFLDAHYILRDQIGRGFSDLKDFAGCAQSTFESMTDFHTDPEVRKLAGSKMFKTLTIEMTWLQDGSNRCTVECFMPVRS
jgi:hypothetical protein